MRTGSGELISFQQAKEKRNAILEAHQDLFDVRAALDCPPGHEFMPGKDALDDDNRVWVDQMGVSEVASYLQHEDLWNNPALANALIERADHLLSDFRKRRS